MSVEARGLFPNPKGTQYYNTPDRFFSRMMYPNGVEVLYFASLNERLRYGDVQAAPGRPRPTQIERLFGKDVPEEIKTFNRNGIMFIGEKGRVFVNRGGVYGKAAEELKDNPLPADAWRVYPARDHMANFFDCVKTRKQPVSPVPNRAPHGHRLPLDEHLDPAGPQARPGTPRREQIVGDDEANAWQSREQRAPYTITA